MAKCFPPACSWSDEERDGISCSSSLNLNSPLLHLPWQPKLGSSSSSSSSEGGRDSAALRIHSEAERRRRERINAHLSTLRRMIPNSAKMDKASLLGRVADHLKDLKRKAVDIDGSLGELNDAVDVEFDSDVDDEEKVYIKASVCCDDRPELLEDLTEAFERLRLRAIRAEMMTLGGRAQSAFVLCLKEEEEEEEEEEEDCHGRRRRRRRRRSVCLSSLKRSIREMLGRVAASDMMTSSNVFSSKRRRRRRRRRKKVAMRSQ